MFANHLRQPTSQCGTVRPPIRHGAALDGLSDAAAWLRETLREWRRRIDERNRLAELSDRTLQDIGLTRAEALYLSDKPFWRE